MNLLPRAASHRVEELSQGRQMVVDRAGLGLLGFIFGGVTAAVMLVACTVVIGHIEGRLVLDPPAEVVAVQ
jgi:hypothetical protein